MTSSCGTSPFGDLPAPPSKGVFITGSLHYQQIIPLNPPVSTLLLYIYLSNLQPNGRWEVKSKICLTFSNFHPELWQPAWTSIYIYIYIYIVRTMLQALIPYMIVEESFTGIGALSYSPEIRKNMAKKSREFVCENCGPISAIMPIIENVEELEKITEKDSRMKMTKSLEERSKYLERSVQREEDGNGNDGDNGNDVDNMGDNMENIYKTDNLGDAKNMKEFSGEIRPPLPDRGDRNLLTDQEIERLINQIEKERKNERENGIFKTEEKKLMKACLTKQYKARLCGVNIFLVFGLLLLFTYLYWKYLQTPDPATLLYSLP